MLSLPIDPIAKMLGPWAGTVCTCSICLRLALAILLSSIIGCERSSKRHSAGLRTFILVSFSSAMATILDISLNGSFPLLSAACIIGSAMLSGNSILFSAKSQIKGLTTSAGLWACGIVSMAAGAGMYTAVLIAFALLLGILMGLPLMEVYLKNRSNHFEIHLELKRRENLQDFVTTVRRLGLHIDDIESNVAYIGSGLSVYTITITIESAELKKYKTHSEIIEALSTLDYIYHIEEMK